MTDPSIKYWSDIHSAIEAIEAFTQGIDTLNGYIADRKTMSAVERQLAIIGEAMNKLIKHDPGLKVDSAMAIVGMRNRLIHSYDNVDNKIVWQTIRLDLPELRTEAAKRLGPIG